VNKTDFAIDLPDYGSDEESERKIIRVENYELKPMNVGEAILQLEVLDYRFLFFYNTETDSPGVVYNRDDGNIGLIEG
jgi:putative sigma-54 modulation protein